MAYEEAVRSITLNADATLARYTGVPGMPGSSSPNYGNVYRFVKITAPRSCGLATDATDDSTVGVMNNKPQVNTQAATVTIRGISIVMCGGTFSAGDKITTDSQGRAVEATSGDVVLGIAVEDSAGENTLSSVLLRLAS